MTHRVRQWPCRRDGCSDAVRARGLCNKHWQQWRKTADESEVSTPPKSLLEAFGRQLVQHPPREMAECLEWTGQRGIAGYGTLGYGGKTHYAHRVVYELVVDEIPAGWEVDHRCFNTTCINPRHLRAVTHKQNTEHRDGAYSNSLTGVRGVTYDKRRDLYRARVKHDYREIYVGRFATLAEAEAAVVAKRNELFTHNDLDRGAA